MRIYLGSIIALLLLTAAACNDQNGPNSRADLSSIRELESASPEKGEEPSGNEESKWKESPFIDAGTQTRSTFSIDVDRASYSHVRQLLHSGQWPHPAAVRIEELINYFSYSYPQPPADQAFAVYSALGDCPWNRKNRLLQIGLQGKSLETASMPSSNFVFLVDVSGSMNEPNKLPLVKSALELLVEQLRASDRVAIVVYAGAAGVVLPSTSGDQKSIILGAIHRLEAGGSTAGGAGISLAYRLAREHFLPQGNNRVILATDGDFNVGPATEEELVKLIEEERKSGVFLSVLGFGTGNYRDRNMQELADRGNGNHAYIDDLKEARKLLVREFGGTLHTIAKDVKIQVEFDPTIVKSYRLIGYENRVLENKDFSDDRKDAGELGSGHTVTALYELVLQDPVSGRAGEGVSPGRVRLRYKAPDGDQSRLVEARLGSDSEIVRPHLPFTAAVAHFGHLLRGSSYCVQGNWETLAAQAERSSGNGGDEDRKEFLQLVQAAAKLDASRSTTRR